ncbi:vanin-like protein 2 [Drosophila gunungcola]|uniref:vanin-like protein 2 n=1 Tax=Drosophila gunungcola TaxID=103775 RepID=UPI0022E06318|nr:vanin-like protein 2 [Drosophila gunungcola]
MAKYSSGFFLFCITLGLMFELSQQASVSKRDYYTAGVVEFRPSNLVSDNLAAYLEIIQSKNASFTDIIVFPESTLNDMGATSFVPNPEHLINPCLSDPKATYYEDFLVILSCAARNASKYIVINLTEKQMCEDVPEDSRPCALDGFNVFNTNVVFDRQGVVVSRYRKVHLYGEPKNSTFRPELSTFETDFGVTFGHFICFDILFYTPAHQLVDQGVTDFVYPAMWFSQLPFLTAVQIQLGWAYANDVNLLASGASDPAMGTSGSGIYHGRSGSLERVMRQDAGERTIYVAQLPKYKGRRRMKRDLRDHQVATGSRFNIKRDYLENFSSEELPVESGKNGHLSKILCHGDFCCHYDLAWRSLANPAENSSSYSYRIGIFEGWRNEKRLDVNYIRNCGLFTCSGNSIDDCGRLLPDLEHPLVTFTHLEIRVTYPQSREFLLLPDTLLDNLLPLEPKYFEWSRQQTSEEGHQVRFGLRQSQEVSNLLTFAIYGNYYYNDCTFGVGTVEEQLACGFKHPKI